MPYPDDNTAKVYQFDRRMKFPGMMPIVEILKIIRKKGWQNWQIDIDEFPEYLLFERLPNKNLENY
jgi:hypothetical protein